MGWWSSQPHEQHWLIGIEAFRLGSAFLRRRKLAEQGRPDHPGADGGVPARPPISLWRTPIAVVFVSQVETHEAIRAFFRPGTRSPLHCSGIGKAILAHGAVPPRS